MKHIDAEKVRAEIERLKSTNPSEYNYQNAEGYIWALDDLLSFLDTLSEEPDKTLEEAAEDYAWEKQEHHIDFDGDEYLDYGPRYDAFIAGAKWQEKRDEETIKTAEDHAFLAGADWQKEQFEKNRLAHCDAVPKEDYDRETDFAMEIIEEEHRQPTFIDAINYGMRLQKEQMMEDAVECVVEWYDGFYLPYTEKQLESALMKIKAGIGDDVKLIIVKED